MRGFFLALSIILTAPAVAAESPKPFRIGLLSEPGADRGIAGLDRLKHVFTMGLGQPVEIMVAKDYAALIEGQASGRLDYAVYSAMAYAVAWRHCKCVEPIVAPVSAKGDTGIAATLFTRTGDIPEEAVVTSGSTAIAGLLHAAHPGIVLTEMPGEEAEAMFAQGRADALLGWMPAGSGNRPEGGTLSRLQALGMPEPAIAWQSATLPNGAHALRSDVPGRTRARLLAVLVGLHEAEPAVYQAMERSLSGGFRPVRQDDYQPALDLLPPETPAVAGLGETVQGLR
jgi:phosphonate transport system substrate-binding protein